MIPRLNGLYKHKHDDLFTRVLFVNQKAKIFYSCEVDENGNMIAWPEHHFTFEQFISDFKNLEVLFKDIFLPKVVSLSKRSIEIQDELYKAINEIVDEHEPEIYFPGMRYRVIQKWRTENNNAYGVSTLYGHIENYLAGGRHKNLLAPGYHKCGNSGVDKPISKSKYGRPRFKDVHTELILTEKDIKIIQDSYRMHVTSTSTNATAQGYDLMIKEHYLRKERFPSLIQFKTHGEKTLPSSERQKAKLGAIIYDKDYKPSIGPLNAELDGPGSSFMVDATKDNTNLASLKFHNKYYGRCTLYLTVDAFSGMIPGFFLTPDNASYNSWKLSMYHCGIPKGQWLKEIGLEKYTDEDWPCMHMPHRFITDRAPENISYKAESLPNNLEITLSNVKAYSPQLKGIIEKAIGDLLYNLRPLLTGSGLITKGEKRIQKDTKHEAYLTYIEMTQIIAEEIIFHNNHHVMKTYQRTPEMMEDNVPCIPLYIWNWAMTKGLGSLRGYDKEDLWRKLMEYDNASFNKEGYLFKGQRWVNLDEEGELLRANLLAEKKNGDEVIISFNPLNIRETYLFHNNKFYPLKPYENLKFETLFDLTQEEVNKSNINSVFESQETQLRAEKIDAQLKIIEAKKKSVKKLTKNSKTIVTDGRKTKADEILDFNTEYQKNVNNSTSESQENLAITPLSHTSLTKVDRTSKLKQLRDAK